MYKISRNNTYMNHLTDTPCGICPVIRQCSDGGVISPTTCQYMSEWLKSSYKDDDITNW
jgi:DNA-directed RNA polymerase III subunit RPC6